MFGRCSASQVSWLFLLMLQPQPQSFGIVFTQYFNFKYLLVINKQLNKKVFDFFEGCLKRE